MASTVFYFCVHKIDEFRRDLQNVGLGFIFLGRMR